MINVPLGSNFKSKVKVYEGKTTLSGVDAELSLENGVIALTRLENANANQNDYFKCSFSQVVNIKKHSTVLYIQVAGKVYKVEFGYKLGLRAGARAGYSAGNGNSSQYLAGKGASRLNKELEQTGYYWWLDTFKQAKVPVSRSKSVYIVIAMLVLFGIVILLLPK